MSAMQCFQPAREQDLEAVYSLIRERIRWMDEKGLGQWNKVDYFGVYPESYFREAMADKRLYVLRGEDGEGVAGAAVISDADAFWPEDGESALYLHNLVTDVREAGKGLGDMMLWFCEVLARTRGRSYMRLDCAKDNAKLNTYYALRGFLPAGEVCDGPYMGVLRQKDLTKGCSCGHGE